MAVKPIRYRGETFRIAYDIVNPEADRDLIFLHGWGSSKEVMKQPFAQAFGAWRHIYIDLPGFGKSSNDMVLQTEDYAAIVDLFLQNLGANKEAAVGHSFGGKVATLIKPERLVLLSSAGIVLPKPFKVRAKIALFKLLKPFGGTRLRNIFASSDAAGMAQNMYETFKNVVDEDFRSEFAAFDKPALLLWGTQDTATPPVTGETLAKLMQKSEFSLIEGDHYFFLKNRHPVISKMEAFLETV
ncbi:alpha/beta fold hydrolase [Hydrogenimonas urashimensis]|uniref:alpha/beta fold hydrolase n=1 Tax=Hydrogenimonas urashimensis TaxID=2740515 RepID=UPI001915422A|nr:alpha/beta hydrolase [Hydrogenimonas urashimensis]